MLNDEIKYDWLSKDNWLSVNDRLPENDDLVLIFSPPNARLLGFFSSGQNIWYEWYGMGCPSIDGITHWMPLPDPPNDSE